LNIRILVLEIKGRKLSAEQVLAIRMLLIEKANEQEDVYHSMKAATWEKTVEEVLLACHTISYHTIYHTIPYNTIQ
jgi:hypothetical protein